MELYIPKTGMGRKPRLLELYVGLNKKKKRKLCQRFVLTDKIEYDEHCERKKQTLGGKTDINVVDEYKFYYVTSASKFPDGTTIPLSFDYNMLIRKGDELFTMDYHKFTETNNIMGLMKRVAKKEMTSHDIMTLVSL